MPTLMRDELAQAQLTRALGYAPYGGADLGECLAIADRLRGASPGPWFDAWSSTATRLQREAARSEVSGDVAGARAAYFRASNYFRTAGVLLLAAPLDPRLQQSRAAEVETFRLAAALLPVPPETVVVPYADGILTCSFFRPADDGRPRPTVLLTNGYDGSAEELYFTNGVAALERGYNVVTFDGPGQGSMLIEHGIPMRPDWENVITPIVDMLVQRSDVDATRIVLIGLSLGGYLAPRAATREHRIAACVSDCGPYDVADAAIARIPTPLVPAIDATAGWRVNVLRRVLRSVLAKPSAGWALRRNLLVHGLTDPLEYFREARRYTLKGREADITCPTFVCTTDRDDLSAKAPTFYAALICPKHFVRFRTEDGAGDHCEGAARTLFHETVFGWLQTTLDTSPLDLENSEKHHA